MNFARREMRYKEGPSNGSGVRYGDADQEVTEYAFTVFTATYNRAHTLHRVYESLSRQTFRDFEWIVIDDGSADGTRALVKGWIRNASFRIQYEYQPNQGKHVAFNHGVRLARGRFFLPLDSDDSCVPEALQVFHDAWEDIPANLRNEYSGVCSLVMDEHGRLIGEVFPKDVFDAPNRVVVHKYRVKGEKWGFQRTEVLRQFPFPELPGQHFVPESVVWGRIANHYSERFINRMLRTYFNTAPTQSDQLTAAPVWKSAQGRLYGHVSALNEQLTWVWYDPMYFFKAAVNISRIGRHARVSWREQWRQLKGSLGRILWVGGIPVGFVLYLRDCRRRAISEKTQQPH